ncbi:HD domain-containing protein [Pseudobacteroides cellulosolvens]|uniref:Metal-dependent phosphohydrolase HD sub domain-containing protein n=1 Tax=Pseudobacteroides cellulosolvens ATCC 35603 = DSM 2933 TaxID=398512 RepID=A0A0L6JQQ4_9FIRM|nr:HD domain-containing protein [Pseudobacteroides cellulosolvens]KNY28118.1 metal-dependent phosphohydrolase HD sub domain-containing protein [Pseudobacteroides cellulosolvens ATCC 35603 = DSM 2933]
MISKALESLIDYNQQDVRRINHAIKVYGFAKTISGKESVTEEIRTVIELAAVLHDIGIKEAERKYNSSAGKYQEIEGPPIAERILKKIGMEQTIINRVCYLIGNHHSYSKIDGIDFQILIEADFIVNIDEDSLDIISIKSIKEKYFKTDTGNKIIEAMYGI